MAAKLVARGLPDVVYENYDGWSYPSWFFSTARFIPGGPTWYGQYDMRTPALLYLNPSMIIILLVVAVLVCMYLVIVPVVKYRTYSTITAVNAIGVGLTIALCMVMPEWVIGKGTFKSLLNHYSPTVYKMQAGIHIGLTSFNITLDHLQTLQTPNNSFVSSPKDFWYNEAVNIFHPETLEMSLNYYLGEGMPTPLLTILSFLTGSSEGFEWPHRLSEAGFHCYIILLAALILWFVALLLIAFIPRYSSFAFIGIGALMVINTIVYFYWAKTDCVYPVITVADRFIKLSYGPCFWSCLGIGGWSIIYGFTLLVIDIIHPDKFITIFDVEYDEKRTLARAYQLNKFEEDKDLKFKNPQSIRCAFPYLDNL